MDRKTFIGALAAGAIGHRPAIGSADRTATFAVVVVTSSIEMDLNPADGGPVMSVRMHALSTESLDPARKQECESAVAESYSQYLSSRDLASDDSTVKTRQEYYAWLINNAIGHREFEKLLERPEGQNLSQSQIKQLYPKYLEVDWVKWK